MLTLYRCDRAAEALRVYRQARWTMIDELGIEPSERLQQLEYAIVTCDRALDPPAAPIKSTRSRSGFRACSPPISPISPAGPNMSSRSAGT
jgi:DNA-binding SARP family transcriptional activator